MNYPLQEHPTPAALTSLVTDLYIALAAGEITTVQRVLSPDVVLHVPGTHPLAGAHVGPRAVIDFITAIRGVTDGGEQIEPLELLTGERSVAVRCRVTATRGERRLDNTTIHFLRVEDGSISEIWLHNWDDVAVNEFWS